MAESLAKRYEIGLRRRVGKRLDELGYGRVGSIPETMTFREWAEDLGKKGLKVDRKPFKLDDRPALVPIYDAIPTTKAEAYEQRLIIQKATQIGLTVWEVLADIYMAKKWSPVNIALYLPDKALASFKSEQRFMQILRSAPVLYRELVNRFHDDGTVQKIGEGNVLTREIANSLLMFLWTSGKASTESRPADIVSLDEVQNMSLSEIDKVIARMGDSDVKFCLMLSTANMPDMDINFWYKLGTQEVWHTRCASCGEYSDLSEPAGIFPARSIAYNKGEHPGAPMGEFIYTCPLCSTWIKDAQQGKYIQQNFSNERNVRSLMLPRTISPKITPREIVTDYNRAKTGDQKKSFFNRTLARPYIDADQLPVTMEHCNSCVADGMKAGLRWETEGRGTYMGIDQMGGFNAVIIKRRMPDGRQAVVHVEAIFDLDPFAKCSLLMKQYGVAVCVVEQLPNVNDARRFTNRHPGRVFMCTAYTDATRSDMISWGDDISKSDRRTTEDDRDRYAVHINQYKAMQTTLFRIRDRMCLFPDPSLLEQDVLDGGETKRIVITRDWVFLHYTKTAMVVEEDDETRKLKPSVRKVGLDPHFSYATMLCDVAWAREQGGSIMFLPDQPGQGAATDLGKAVEERMPGLPAGVINMIDSARVGGTCGACYSFAKSGFCEERNVRVAASMPACELYMPVDG